MLLVEAVVELLAEKGVLTGEEAKERVKKLKAETTLNTNPLGSQNLQPGPTQGLLPMR